MMKHPLIESNPAIMIGKPVIRGTRITVDLILEELAAGESVEQIVESHPPLTEEAIRAALAFGVTMVRRPGRRSMCHSLIESDPAVKMGKPVIRGTRITVEMILEKLGAGETIADLLDAYPSLTEEAIRAALTFAAEALRADVVYPVRVPAE